MIDHLLGRPSPSWKRFQVFLVSFTWFLYLHKADSRGPSFCRKWNEKLSRFTPFQLIAGTLAVLYMLKNADRMIGLGAPEPLSRLYSRNFYRATWILTALDAGFWTAMSIRPKFLRDIMSIVFSIYYLIFADQADEKTRRIRATITVECLRVSWEKTLNPILRTAIKLTSPRLSICQKKALIPRPKNNPHGSQPVVGYIYYDGTQKSFENSDKLILNYPGGGFITMPPPCHESYLRHWAKKTRAPILSIEYAKAPEFPYPYALEECFDVYQSIMESNGEVIGMAGWTNKDGSKRKQINIVLIGDSAGGNIVTSVMFKILESPTPLPHPNALILIYPCLSFDITCWMSPSQISLIRAESTPSIHGVLESKDHLSHKSPLAVVPDIKKKRRWSRSFSESREDEKSIEERVKYIDGRDVTKHPNERNSRPIIGTRLAMTSRMSYFNDRIITPDMMRAMAILYLGPNNYPDFSSDYLLSPMVGPDELLAQFPKVYLMCGEKDPFVDDTVVFAGRIREAKRRKKQTKFGENLRMSSVDGADKSDVDDWVEVKILQGISHAFLIMMALLPESSGAVRVISRWLTKSLEKGPDLKSENERIVHDDDEGLMFLSRHSTVNDIAKIQRDGVIDISPHEVSHNDKILSTSPKSSVHISHSLSDISDMNENSHKPSSSPMHTSASEVVLTPVNERECVLWEQQNILNEDQILKRRRDTLLSHLKEGATITSQESTETKK